MIKENKGKIINRNGRQREGTNGEEKGDKKST
jgi:hypothetical protein